LSIVQDSPETAQALADAWVSSLAQEVSNIENQQMPGVADAEEVTAQSVIKVLPLVEASKPSTPHSPNGRLALALGALSGLVLGLALTALRSVNDRRIKSSAALEEDFGLTVLGTIPVMSRKSTKAKKGREKRGSKADRAGRATLRDGRVRNADASDTAVTFHFAESFKELRTNLQFIRPDNPPRIIVITSALPAEGKSTVAANTAITLAESGIPTVLVDADLRRPTVAGSFHVEGSVGLTNTVIGNAEVWDVLQPVPDVGDLKVLASGPVPPNPSEILASARLESVLRSIAEDHVVIVDAPPLLPVTDAAILAAKYDGCVLVVTAGQTTRDELAKALGNLAKVNGTVLGAVLNSVPTTGPE
ncbi:CpsD/CapB family tyrosine-protein kinase, partial [Mesorhizobium sp. B2-6-6]|uniref:CpsD/CapB family tyrosine-protein kinase n=1 Tax=Mesorhizobium sp. B2-6-6 TaxID=2589911 RepID=UPI001125C7F9